MEGTTGIVLAGGKSERFGSDKAMALLDGRPLLDHVLEALDAVCAEIVVAGGSAAVQRNVDGRSRVRFVPDETRGRGPLAGLIAGLGASRTELCFASSCDAPLLNGALVEFLSHRASNADVVCAEIGGRLEPLSAVFRAPACLPHFRACLEHGTLKLSLAYAGLRLVTVPEVDIRAVDPELASFLNVNRPEALREVEAMGTARAGRKTQDAGR